MDFEGSILVTKVIRIVFIMSNITFQVKISFTVFGFKKHFILMLKTFWKRKEKRRKKKSFLTENFCIYSKSTFTIQKYKYKIIENHYSLWSYHQNLIAGWHQKWSKISFLGIFVSASNFQQRNFFLEMNFHISISE